MNREDEITRHIASALAELHELNGLAREPNEFLAINDAEIAMHDVRKAFEMEIPKG